MTEKEAAKLKEVLQADGYLAATLKLGTGDSLWTVEVIGVSEHKHVRDDARA